MSSSAPPSGEHFAAIIPEKLHRFTVVARPTPKPGPNEYLIEVKAIAVNPIDYYQRDFGRPQDLQYPAVLGSDIAGIIVSAGSDLSSSSPKPGDRVAAFAPSFYEKGAHDYGAFQKYVRMPAENVAPLPDSITFEEGSILPMAVETAWAGWYSIGISHDAKYTPADKQAVLVWGGATSVGTAAIQSARLMGFTIYTTASEKHHDYLKKLGATHTFDYKADGVVSQIVDAVKKDGVTMTVGYAAAPNSLVPCQEILRLTKGDATAKLAHAPPLPPDSPTVEGVVAKFVMAPNELKARDAHFYRTFRVWLAEKLASGEFVPSPQIQIVDGGLESVNAALDLLKGGVSGTKLVVPI